MNGCNIDEDSPEEHPFDTTLSTTASETDLQEQTQRTTATISGASGKHLAEELKRWMDNRSKLIKRDSERLDLARNTWEKVELRIAAYYDAGPLSAFINFLYDILQLSSGRDKFCALLQGYSKMASSFYSKDSERYFMYRGIEESMSDGRKIFRLFKEFREVYKVRRGFHRMQEGIAGHGITSPAAICGTLDVMGHIASFFYYLYDNILWAASVGLFRTKEIPRWQVGMWKGFRRNGKVIESLGGVASIKWRKDSASIWRLNFAITANVLLLIDAIRQCKGKEGGQFQGPDDPRLFHSLELVGMFSSYRILLGKLGFVKLKSHATSGMLAMVAALCGIWSNWRKVRRKNCGTKPFVTVVEQREKLLIKKSASSSDLNGKKDSSGHRMAMTIKSKLEKLPEISDNAATIRPARALSGPKPHKNTM